MSTVPIPRLLWLQVQFSFHRSLFVYTSIFIGLFPCIHVSFDVAPLNEALAISRVPIPRLLWLQVQFSFHRSLFMYTSLSLGLFSCFDLSCYGVSPIYKRLF